MSSSLERDWILYQDLAMREDRKLYWFHVIAMDLSAKSEKAAQKGDADRATAYKQVAVVALNSRVQRFMKWCRQTLD